MLSMLRLTSSFFVACVAAAAPPFLSALATTLALPQLPPHTPSFRLVSLNWTLVGSTGAYVLPLDVVVDDAVAGDGRAAAERLLGFSAQQARAPPLPLALFTVPVKDCCGL